jgi:hypothetical protein
MMIFSQTLTSLDIALRPFLGLILRLDVGRGKVRAAPKPWQHLARSSGVALAKSTALAAALCGAVGAGAVEKNEQLSDAKIAGGGASTLQSGRAITCRWRRTAASKGQRVGSACSSRSETLAKKQCQLSDWINLEEKVFSVTKNFFEDVEKWQLLSHKKIVF